MSAKKAKIACAPDRRIRLLEETFISHAYDSCKEHQLLQTDDHAKIFTSFEGGLSLSYNISEKN